MDKNIHLPTTRIDQDLKKKFEEGRKKKTSIYDFIDDFILEFLSEETKKAYLKDLMNFFDFLKRGGEIINSPRDIEGHHFRIYRDELIDKKYSSATVNRKLVAIRSFIKWSMATKLIDYNPLDVIKLPKVQTESPTLAFSDEEVLEMINTPDLKTKMGSVHRVTMVLLFSLGLRRSELTHIKLSDFYHDRNHLVLKIRGKGDKERHLPIAPSIEREINEYLDFFKGTEEELFPEDFLIQNKNKIKNTKPVDGSTIYRVIEKYAKLCGINKRVSPHSCRATAISHLLDTQKTPIRDVAIFAGHAKITTTERYDKRREELDHSAAYQVDYSNKKTS